jgi:hypothetical protein
MSGEESPVTGWEEEPTGERPRFLQGRSSRTRVLVYTGIAIAVAGSAFLAGVLASSVVHLGSAGSQSVPLGSALLFGSGHNITAASSAPVGCVDGKECYRVAISSATGGLVPSELTFGAQSAIGLELAIGGWRFTLVGVTGLNLSATWAGTSACTGSGCSTLVASGQSLVFHTGGMASLQGDHLVAVGHGHFAGEVIAGALPLDSIPLGAAFGWGPSTNITSGTPLVGCVANLECYSIEIASAGYGLVASDLAFSAKTSAGGAVPIAGWWFTLVGVSGTNTTANWTGASSCAGAGCTLSIAAGQTIVFHTPGTSSLGGDSILAVGSGGFSGTVDSGALPA